MFQIRQQQYDSMSNRAMEDFERRAIAYLYESNPECVVEIGEQEFDARVKASIKEAMKNGIDLEVFVTKYVQLDLESTLRLEEAFSAKWSKLLAVPSLEQVQKIELLQSLVYDLPESSQSEPDEDE